MVRNETKQTRKRNRKKKITNTDGHQWPTYTGKSNEM